MDWHCAVTTITRNQPQASREEKKNMRKQQNKNKKKKNKNSESATANIPSECKRGGRTLQGGSGSMGRDRVATAN